MIRKLRFKLISAAMISLFIVITIIIGAVNILNYQGIIEDSDQILSILRDNDGRFPQQKNDSNPQEHPAYASGNPSDSSSDSSQNTDITSSDEASDDTNTVSPDTNMTPSSQPQHPEDNPRLQSPELPYESRFFSVLLDADGTVLSTDTGKIAAVDSTKAGEYAKAIWQSGKTRGLMNAYRYLRSETDDGHSRIIFLDCSRSLNSFRNVLLISCGVSGLGLVMVLILMILLSKHIIKPFSENYEKQKRFITDAGHEIKTPITIINADTEVLEMDTGANEWIDDIRVQTERLSHLTKDLIYLARMEEGESKTPMIEFPLSEVVSETAASFQALALTKSRQFTAQIEPMLSFYGNEENIRKLISILLDNAVKYSNENGSIWLTLDKKNKSIQLIVTNTTKDPLDKEQLVHLFDRFYRMDASRNSETGGYGIGLSIAQAVVQMHKGKITVMAVNEHTIRFTCSLPIRTPKSARQ